MEIDMGWAVTCEHFRETGNPCDVHEAGRAGADCGWASGDPEGAP